MTKVILTEVANRIQDPSEGFFIGDRNIRGITSIVNKILADKEAEEKEKVDIDGKFADLKKDMENNIKNEVRNIRANDFFYEYIVDRSLMTSFCEIPTTTNRLRGLRR